MAYLFEIENEVAKPYPEILLIEPFKTIWNRDKSSGKVQAIKEFTFIEFMSSKLKTNVFAGYDPETRYLALKDEYFDESWEMDELIEEAINKIEKWQQEASPTYSYYKSVLQAANKMKNFFRTFNFGDTNDRGMPLYKPADITRALNDTDKVLQNLGNMKKKVEQELYEETKTKGGKVINAFEV